MDERWYSTETQTLHRLDKPEAVWRTTGTQRQKHGRSRVEQATAILSRGRHDTRLENKHDARVGQTQRSASFRFRPEVGVILKTENSFAD